MALDAEEAVASIRELPLKNEDEEVEDERNERLRASLTSSFATREAYDS